MSDVFSHELDALESWYEQEDWPDSPPERLTPYDAFVEVFGESPFGGVSTFKGEFDEM